MADDGSPTGPTGPTGPSNVPKRRRLAEETDDDEAEGDAGNAPSQQHQDDEDANDEAAAGGGGAGDSSRRARLEQRAAERRRRRLQAEVADLNVSYPGDEFYRGVAGTMACTENIFRPVGEGQNFDGGLGALPSVVAERLGRHKPDPADIRSGYTAHNAEAWNRQPVHTIETIFWRVRHWSQLRGRCKLEKGGDGGGARPERPRDEPMDADPNDGDPDLSDNNGGESDGDYIDENVDDAAAVLLGSSGRVRDEDEGDGEDLVENAMQDYQPIAALDTYGTEGIDDREYGSIDADERASAEAVLRARDRERAKLNRDRREGGFYDALLEGEEEEEEEERRRRRGMFERRRDDGAEGMDADAAAEEEDDDNFEDEDAVNLEAFDVPLREWIATTQTRREIQRKFRVFLSTFRDGEDFQFDDEDEMDDAELRRRRRLLNSVPPTYEERIRQMCSANRSALELSYLHLMRKEPVLALWIDEAPRDMLDVLNEAATRHTLRLFPSYHAIRDEIHVRISDVPIVDSLRDLRRSHLEGLVKVSGVITRRSGVFPQLRLAHYDCVKCRATLGPYRVEDSASNGGGGGGGRGGGDDVGESNAPSICPECDSEGPFKLNASRSRYRNYQRVNLQERPGSVPPGRVPRTKEVVLLDDLVDTGRPGEDIEVTGIYCHGYDYHLTNRSGFPVFQTHVLANHIRKREDASSASNLSEADRREILELAADPNIGRRIVASIAPSIYGHEHVKMALAMSLFGAVPKNVDDKHRIRGDVN
ncbi:hypothetical protein THAOC_35968, partial [Thalassiosira oceanica]